jgi:MoaA/NifB/PqqE/SkfB family radical SAM enzyme
MSRVDFGRFTPTITSEEGPIRTNSMELLKSKAGTGEAKLPPLNFLWLEITGKCNFRCTHCYAESAPSGTHGSISRDEWYAIIVDAKQVGADTVQFIGGEPTLHPDFPELVRFAASSGMEIEIFTNLLRVSPSMWSLFEECHVSLATSFYSSDPVIHDRVTTRVGSQQRTLDNIQVALGRSLPLRVGLIKVLPEQDVAETEEMLRTLSITNVTVDTVRGIGRGTAHNRPPRPVDALCGQCASARATVDSEGWVYPCVFSRWLRIGNIRSERFSAIMKGETMQRIREELAAEFFARSQSPFQPTGQCKPNCIPSVGCVPPPQPPSPCPPRR